MFNIIYMVFGYAYGDISEESQRKHTTANSRIDNDRHQCPVSTTAHKNTKFERSLHVFFKLYSLRGFLN